MFAWVKSLFSPRNANPYAHLVAASLAASQSRFVTWEFAPKTMVIDVESASLAELEAALIDCNDCIAAEYPETEDGTFRAMRRVDEIEDAIGRRFGNAAVLLAKQSAGNSAWKVSRRYHG